ncbi:acyl carrier protein [Streptomyces sp. NPDC087440]|uniref:acyl carrier protein n=1 Tax=Streptomyces sp. NPDC087440 TaxID=3365790 RepID=UPI003807818A
MTSTDPMTEVRAFILERNPRLDSVADDLDLIDSRAISSLAFIEFIFLLEELTGKTIDPEDLDLDDFRTLRAIDSRFFVKEAAA